MRGHPIIDKYTRPDRLRGAQFEKIYIKTFSIFELPMDLAREVNIHKQIKGAELYYYLHTGWRKDK